MRLSKPICKFLSTLVIITFLTQQISWAQEFQPLLTSTTQTRLTRTLLRRKHGIGSGQRPPVKSQVQLLTVQHTARMYTGINGRWRCITN